jgi:hypothetical protein
MTEMMRTMDDPQLDVVIEHHRDVIAFDGRVEQDYRYLNYKFAHKECPVEATTYLDDVWICSVTVPPYPALIPQAVLHYLQQRFNVIRQLGGSSGHVEIWKKNQAPMSKLLVTGFGHVAL